MKKLKIIIPILIILFIPIKLFVVSDFKIEDLDKLKKIKNGLIVSDLKVIKTENKENYIEYKNLKIANTYENLSCEEKNNSKQCIFDDKIITMGLTKSIIEQYEEYSSKKIELDDDLLFLGTIKECSNKPNILTSTSKLREEFTLNMFTINNLPIINNIDIIEGDIKGLLFYEKENYRELYLYKDLKTYKVTFKNIDDNTIIELIKTIQID